MQTLVLGIGNLLMGDEGVGVHVLRRLQEQTDSVPADLVDGGTGGFHLLGFFETYERIVLVDAASDGQVPGTVRVIRPRYASDYPPTLAAHDIGLKDLIESVQLLGKRPEVALVTISISAPGDMSLELSDAVESAVESAVRTVRELLAGSHPASFR